MKNRKGTVRAIQEGGTFSYAEDFVTESGRVLPGIDIAYEIYGRMNADKSNAILICHPPLTADAHAAGWHEGGPETGLVGYCNRAGGKRLTRTSSVSSPQTCWGGMQWFDRPCIDTPDNGQTVGNRLSHRDDRGGHGQGTEAAH
ncbi:hypothetical protein [Methanogenium cariaci]|uniref:hypothetical protein n=1 Tax=Methanogenium cariaci TaxID=2197 RepID=UPI000B222CC4|nr:hypothetical protein [Methanogenium cariaci]